MAENTESEALRDVRVKFVGKWRLSGSENFEAFLEEMGAPFPARKMAAFSKPDCEISIVDQQIRIHTWTTFWSQDDSIELGKTYEREIHKQTMKVKASYENGTIITELEPVKDTGKVKPQTVSRAIEGDNMVMTVKVGKVVAKRIFGRI